MIFLPFGRNKQPDPDPGDVTDALEPLEDRRLRHWLEERYYRLGFNAFQSRSLIESRADWHTVARALERGCSHETAIDLFT